MIKRARRSIEREAIYIVAAILTFLSTSTGSAIEPAGIDPGLEKLSGYFETIWRYSVFNVDGKSVEVSQIVIALLMLILGFLISFMLTRRVKKQLLISNRVDENSAAALERIIFYTLLVIVVISSLQMVRIPITMFAFLGGAIAIGVGFGAQNIFNNFISGLILMFERPVRLGDLIEIDGFLGKVVHIGSRCTMIRRIDGIEVLIPNSKLLENNLINRTLSDKINRKELDVGVAYGSPSDKVAEILSQIVNSHPEILSQPPHQVLFHDFGDNALIFKIAYWVELKDNGDMRRVGSDLRFSIDKHFREAGITIAFPQRDIHLDTNRFEVKILSDKDNAGSSTSEGNIIS